MSDSPTEKGETSLRRAAGSKGSLHSLLLQSNSPSEAMDDFADAPGPSRLLHDEWVVCSGRQARSSVSRLSQSYSQPRTPLAIQERLAAADSEMRGELEWFDTRTGEWRACCCVLKDGLVRCLAPGGDESRIAEAMEEAEEVDEELALEELALSMGARGRSGVGLSLTQLALVGTDPYHGPHAFRLVVDRDGRSVERSFRAKGRDEMNEWLFGFHRSLAIVVARLRGQRKSSAEASFASASSLRKKSATRRCKPNDVDEGAILSEIPLAAQSDEGGVLYRKSSARPRARREPQAAITNAKQQKYVPPHLRRAAAAPRVDPPDAFEEKGDADEDAAAKRVPTRLNRADESWCRATGDNTAEPRLVLEWRSGYRCEQGKRRRNEDACVDVSPLISTPEATYAYFGVYDGHSGLDAVDRCAAELHVRVADSLREKRSPIIALDVAFATVDADYCADAAEGRASLDAGATALACVLQAPVKKRQRESPLGHDGPALFVANCGDCFAVLSRGGLAMPLSTPHTPLPGSQEANRVVAAGGWITTETDLCVGRLHAMDLDDPEISARAHERVRLNEIHRVCGEVAVTRAIGDVDFKGWTASALPQAPRRDVDRSPPPFAYPDGHSRRFVADLLIATPEIRCHDLGRDDDFLLLATDGLWDVVEPQEAVTVAASLFKQGHTPQSVAEQLVGRALRLGSGDNVTVVAVQLNWVDVSAVDGVLN